MPLDPADFDYLRTLVLQRTAIVLESQKEYRVEACLAPLARKEGCATASELLAKLRTMPVNGLHQQAAEAFAIHETTFYRDVHPFEALRRDIVPALLAKRPGDPRLAIWCAACSTGQEPYSIAMMLREHFPALDSGRVRLVASDLCAATLERARQGRYSQLEVNRGLPASLLVKYFQRAGTDWQLRDEVRRAVEFCSLNLIERWTLSGPFDVVFLRNVLIYFDVETKKVILERVRSLLRPGGVLFLGGAETTLQLSDAFERVPFERLGYYRVRES